MTGSLSNLPGEGESSLSEPSVAASINVPEFADQLEKLRPRSSQIKESNSFMDEPTVAHRLGDRELSSDELTVISQPPSFETQKENVSTLEGKRIAHFELKQFLGGGGMGLVFRAFDAVLNRSVAIKLLPRSGTSNETLKRFQVEARSAARLDHPNISRIFQVGSEEACDYIIFEYVEGDNLSQLVRRIGPLPLELGLRYTFQLALALQHAYQRGVVHRDVKPANVVVTDGGKLKLIDLGLARSPKANESDQSLTATGVTLGTYDYISPEQARDSRTADVRSDLYSLGCTVFFMFTGRPPYPEGTPIEKIIQHSSEKRPNPQDYRSDLPSGFNDITSKMLAIDPDDRYQRPAELIADIQEFASKNNIPLLGYDDNVIVKRIIQKPSWMMQLIPVMVPLILLVGFVVYMDWFDTGGYLPGDPSQNQSVNRYSATNSDANKNKAKNSSDVKSKGNSESKNAGTPKTGTKSGVGPIKPGSNGVKKAGGGNSKEKKSKSSLPANASLTSIAVGAPIEGFAAFVVSSFEEAIEAANENPRFNEIRINTDKILIERPISLKVSSNLLITSSTSRKPLIVFRPDGSDKNSAFKIRGGTVEFSNLQFRYELSDDIVLSNNNSVSLFEFENVDSTAFNSCFLTLVNSNVDGDRIFSDASFIRVSNTRRGLSTFDSQPREIFSKPLIRFKNCVACGEGNLVKMPESNPITLSFDNGLFVSDERMFDFGTFDSDNQTGSEIEIYLSRLTAISKLGIAKVDGGLAASYLPVRIEVTQSIFNFENNSNFVSHINMPEGFAKNEALVIKSSDSFFPLRNDLWSIDYQNGEIDSDRFDVNSMAEWIQITGVPGNTSEVTWKRFDGLSIPAHEHMVQSYELTGGWDKNPAIRKKAGIDLAEFGLDDFDPKPGR